jgi:LPS sulfotransferase NodH
LTRRDKIRQAISYDRAIRSGHWWSIAATADGNGQPQVLPPFDFEQIDLWVMRLCQFESCWRRHFKRMGVVPFEIAYEDLVAGYDGTISAILGFLDLPFSKDLIVAPPRLERQADRITEEWVLRYRRIKGLS